MRSLVLIALLLPAYLLPASVFAAPVSYVFSGHITDTSHAPAGFTPQTGDAITGTLTYDTDYHGTFAGSPWPANTPALLDWSLSINGESYFLYSSPASPASNPLWANDHTVNINSMFGHSAGLPAFDNEAIAFKFGGLSFSGVPDQLPVSDFISGSFSFGGTASSPGAGFKGTIDSLSSVPLPAAAWMFGAGLLGLGGVARRRNSVKDL